MAPVMRLQPISCFLALILAALQLLSLPSPLLADEPAATAAFLESTANGVRREGLDKALRKYALMALAAKGAKTGVAYNVSLPPSLEGVECQAMRVRVGSVRRRGVVFNEFNIPQGVTFSQTNASSPFVFFVYRRITTTSFTLYSPPDAFSFAGPIVGIVVFSGNSSISVDDSDPITPLSEITVVSPLPSISAELTISTAAASCCFFDINGTAAVVNAISSSVDAVICNTTSNSDVVLVVSATSSISEGGGAGGPSSDVVGEGRKGSSSGGLGKLAAVAVAGGVGAVVLLAAILYVGWRLAGEGKGGRRGEEEEEVEEEGGRKRRRRWEAPQLEEEEEEEAASLQTSLIGNTRAPTAPGLRTRPTLETGSLYPLP